jgi:hypothetical protein
MIDSQQHIIGLVFYPGMTSLDIIGPELVEKGLLLMQGMMPNPVGAN